MKEHGYLHKIGFVARYFLSFFIPVLFFIPIVAIHANPPQSKLSDAAAQVESRGIVPCEGVGYVKNPDGTYKLDGSGKRIIDPEQECNYETLIGGINTFIKYFLYLANFIAIAMLAWGGMTYFVAAADPGKKARAKEMIWTVIVGLFFVYTGWLIVYVILDHLLTNPRIDNPLNPLK